VIESQRKEIERLVALCFKAQRLMDDGDMEEVYDCLIAATTGYEDEQEED
jgi:hypothetical protein